MLEPRFGYKIHITGKHPLAGSSEPGFDRTIGDRSNFSKLLSNLEAPYGEMPLSMEAECVFEISVETEGWFSGPINPLKRFERNGLLHGQLKLFQLYPRLFHIRQLYELADEPASEFRLVAHIMNGQNSQGWVAVNGNSVDELCISLKHELSKYKEGRKRFEQLLENSNQKVERSDEALKLIQDITRLLEQEEPDETSKQIREITRILEQEEPEEPSYLVHIHGFECPEPRARYGTGHDKDLSEAVTKSGKQALTNSL